jgi:ammonium transporter, Amt family
MRKLPAISALLAVGLVSLTALADEPAAVSTGPSTADLQIAADTIWVLITGMLVFWMNAGFALVESGFCRKKNAVNILGKNFVVFAATTLIYYAVGFALQYGNGNDFIGLTGFFVPNDASLFESLSWTKVPVTAKFFFQLVFAGTAATIVSGAVAERIHYKAFIAFAVVMGAVIYPIGGHWIWGGGFLSKDGMFDFAGSTVVHSIGGWAALVGILVLGPRIGKYKKDGKVSPIPGHNMTSATLGTFILWLGWFGFNPGSTMAANPEAISHIVFTTNMAAAAGAFVATMWAWKRSGTPDLGMTCNGCLAGLVAITAPCAFVTGPMAILIGSIGGFLVVEGVILFDKIKVDDPVGATSVHLLNGVFGTLAVGLFGDLKTAKAIAGVDLKSDGLFLGGGAAQVLVQLKGVVAVGVFTVAVSFLFWYAIKAIFGLRVTKEDEIAGLDVSEMGMEAYPDDADHGYAELKAAAKPAEALATEEAPAGA